VPARLLNGHGRLLQGQDAGASVFSACICRVLVRFDLVGCGQRTRFGGAAIPRDRPIDGVDQLDFFLGKQEASNREGFPAYVADRLTAVKWRNWKAHFIKQDSMYDVPEKLPLPKVINLLTDRKEERDVGAYNSWVADPVVKIVGEFEASLQKYPPIKVGTPDPYTPPAAR
jgi:hypothetical protein